MKVNAQYHDEARTMVDVWPGSWEYCCRVRENPSDAIRLYDGNNTEQFAKSKWRDLVGLRVAARLDASAVAITFRAPRWLVRDLFGVMP